MNHLRVRRPYDESSDFTLVTFDGEEEDTLQAILLATLGRQDWEMEQFLDGEWEPMEVEE
jgi:hypothetical protein